LKKKEEVLPLEPESIEDRRDFTVLRLLKVNTPHKYIKVNETITELGYERSKSKINIHPLSLVKSFLATMTPRKNIPLLPSLPSVKELTLKRKVEPFLH
jgi:hypothetical protein